MSITLFPIPIDSRLIQSLIETNTAASNNFVPFQTISQSVLGAFRQDYFLGFAKVILGNIVMMIPIGFYLPLIRPNLHSRRNIFILGFSAAISMEILQKIISLVVNVSYRSFDVDDIILNTIGVLIGSIILKLVNPLIKRLKGYLDDNQSETFTY